MCRWVDLSHSGRLSELEPHAFPSILRLQSLSLAHTAITSLPPDTVPARRLLLDGVRLACTCQQLAWLATDDVSAADDDVTSGATCLSPGRLYGRPLGTLSAAELGCSSGPTEARPVEGGGRGVEGELLVIVGIVSAGALVSTLGVCTISISSVAPPEPGFFNWSLSQTI